MHNIHLIYGTDILTETPSSFSLWLSEFKKRLLYVLDKQFISSQFSVIDTCNDLPEITPENYSEHILLPIIGEIPVTATNFPQLCREIEERVEEFPYLKAGVIKIDHTVSVPDELRNLMTIPLYEVGQDTFSFLEKKTTITNYFYPPALSSLVPLVNYIGATLSAKNDQRNSVFVADTSEDCFLLRNAIIRELRSDGFQMLPYRHYQDNGQSVESLVSNDLNKSVMSIHIFGNELPQLRSEEATSLQVIEYDLAAEKFHKLCNDYGDEVDLPNSRVIWVPSLRDIKDDKLKSFYSRILNDTKLTKGADIIQGTLQDVKEFVLKRIGENQYFIDEENGDITTGDVNTGPMTCIICSDQNKAEADRISELLKSKSIGSRILIGNYNEKQIYSLCNSVLLIAENERPEWLRSKLNRVYKLNRFNKGRGLKKAVIAHEVPYLPEHPFNDLIKINYEDNISLEDLEPFLP